MRRSWIKRRRSIALVLCFLLLFSIGGNFAAAADASETGLCEHHPVHTEDCGYRESAAGADCIHEHDGTCGYREAADEVPCSHIHDADCGYAEAQEEIPCDKGCFDEDGDGLIDHSGDCAYTPAKEEAFCTHEHDEACGYRAAEEEQPCTHEHDEACGYVAAEEGSSCTFRCLLCDSDDYPAVADPSVSIIVPVMGDADRVTAGSRTDLLEGVSVEGDGRAEDYTVRVLSVTDSETGLPVALEEERFLTAETGHSYLIVYVAYDEAGELAVTAERVVSAADRATSEEAQMEESPMAETPSYVYQITLKDGTTVSMTRMIEYADATAGSDVTITISDKGDKVLQPGENGEYEVTAGEQYNVNFLYSGNVLEKGKYYITFTAAIDNFNQNGNLTFTGNNGEPVELGTWSFAETSDGKILLVFDITADMEHYSNITLGAKVACTFSFENNDLDFDGGINITVKPGENTGNTEVNKWSDGLVEGNSKIRWGSEIYGYSNSNIVGSTITDTLTTPETHYYTQADMDNGITFYARQYRPGAEVGGKEGVLAEHRWKVVSGDSGLDWTENGWRYTMPETVFCLDCEKTVSLGDAQWYYYFSYTSTVKEPGSEGYTVYENRIAVDGDEDTANVKTGLEKPTGTVVKNGHYNHVELTEEELKQNNDNPYAKDTFVWDITATIPGADDGKRYICTWRFYDGMTVGESNQSYEPQDLTVTAEIGGETYTVYEYNDPRATQSPICYKNSYTSSSSGSREFDFYCQCDCEEDTCGHWENGGCGTKHSSGWCECWNIMEDTKIIFHYSTEAGALTESSGGQTLVNNVELGYTLYPEGVKNNFAADKDDADVKIPGLFTKVRTEAPTEENGLLAEYAITVNEGMADLKSAHQGITIVDKMSKTLNFVASTLQVTRTDAQGNVDTLANGTDYTFTYDTKGSENNILTIVLKEGALGPCLYTLIYDASVRGTSENQTTYQNTAEVTLFGQTRNVDSGELSLPSAAVSAVTYSAMLVKQDSEDTAKRLANAEFALYQAVETETGVQGIYMGTYTTDENGYAEIQTDTTKGVIFNAHVLYYLEETEAPDGYRLDSGRHFFWFCDNNEEISCSRNDEWNMEPINGQCIYSIHREGNEDWNQIVITNEPIPNDYTLPETGGPGTVRMRMEGMLWLLAGAGALLFGRARRKRN